MKIYINKYRGHWLSPYTVLEKVLFWKDWENIDYDEPWVEKWSSRLNPVCQALQKVLDIVHPKIDYVKIDHWDTWNMDGTLAQIILPMLRQLQKEKHGAPFVDDEDVPEGMNLRSTEAEPKENEWDTDSNHFLRWDWIMDELIWTFDQLHPDNDWEQQYYSGKHDIQWKKLDNGMSEMVRGPKDTFEIDMDGLKAHQARIANGLRLFGKYYQGLWD
jgi:hypothetical protein